MKILDRYIIKTFVKTSFYTLLLTTAMMVIINLFINFNDYTTLKITQTLTIMFLHLPNDINLVIGPSLLFATTYFISSLYSNNEFISLLSAGISYKRIIAPIIIMSFIFTGILFVFNEKVKNTAEIKYDSKRIEYDHKDAQSYQYDNRNVTLTDKDKNITVRASRYYENSRELTNIIVALFNEDNTLKEKITAGRAKYSEEDDIWKLKNVIIYRFDGENLGMTAEKTDEYEIENFKIKPTFFRAQGEDIRTMNILKAYDYLNVVKYMSQEIYAEKCTEFYQRIFSPFIALIMIFVSLSINLKNKRNVLMYSIISALSLGVIYYAMDFGFTLMAKQGIINPLLGTLIPIGTIVLISLFGASRVST